MMAPMPALPGGQPYLAGAAGVGWAINSKAAEPEAAERFLEFLASEEALAVFHENTGSIITTSNFDPTVDPAFEPIVGEIKAGNFYLPQLSWKRYEDALNTEAVAQLQLMVQGKSTPAQVAEALDRKLASSGG